MDESNVSDEGVDRVPLHDATVGGVPLCSNCGARISEPPRVRFMRCPLCGEVIKRAAVQLQLVP